METQEMQSGREKTKPIPIAEEELKGFLDNVTNQDYLAEHGLEKIDFSELGRDRMGAVWKESYGLRDGSTMVEISYYHSCYNNRNEDGFIVFSHLIDIDTSETQREFLELLKSTRRQ